MPVWHVSPDYVTLHEGRLADCAHCKHKKKKPRPEKPKSLSYEEARKLIDRCSCGAPIKPDNITGKCAECLPAWKAYISKLDKRQGYYDDDEEF
jgi:NAD-dependent SIR2 family protein deacetylase